MENWLETTKALFRVSSTRKEYKGYSGTEPMFSGDNIVSGSVKITQSICDAEQLSYGNVEASMLELRLADSGDFPISVVPAAPLQLATNLNEPVRTALPEDADYMLREDRLKGYEITLKQLVDAVEVPIGVFIVDEAKVEADTWFKKIVAYDRLSKFRRDVAAWYNALTFPITLKAFRESLCTYVGVPFESVTLPNDSVAIDKTVEPSVLPGTDVLKAVCELSACWAQMSPEGTLRWVTLAATSSETFDYSVYDQTYMPESTRESFVSKAINAVVIRETEDDIGGHYPATLQDNPYIIQDNFLAYGKSTADLELMSQAILDVIGNKPYKPHTTLVSSRPYLQCGDMITVVTQSEAFDTYILKRVITGEIAVKDSFEAQGKENVEMDYSVSRQVIQLKGKTNELTRTVDSTISRVEDLEVGFSTIDQYVDSITLSVTNGVTSSMVKLMAGTAEISSQEIKFTGIVTFDNLTDGVTQISGSNITTGLVAAARIDVDNLVVKHLNGADGTFSGTLAAVTTQFNTLQSGNVSISGSSIISSGPFTISSQGGSGYNFLEFYSTGGISISGTDVELLNSASGNIRMANLKSSTGATVVFGTSNGNLAYSGSSRRYKHNIKRADHSEYRKIIERFDIDTFVMNNDELQELQLGVVAEELDEFCPILVGYRYQQDGTKIPDFVKYDRIPLIMIPVLKEMLADIDELKRRMEVKKGG